MDDSDWQAWGIPLIVIGVILLIIGCLLLLRWYVRRPMYHGAARMDGKTVVITGANTGIGKETARGLVERGAKVIILCRNTAKGQTAAEEIQRVKGEPIQVYKIDLSDLESVRTCAEILKETEPKIDVLINNAGLFWTEYTETKEGIEVTLCTNHLGHFLLTLLLLDNIKAAAPSRIVNVSSLGHSYAKMKWDDLNRKKNYGSGWDAYCQSKLANVLFTKSLAKKLEGTGVTSYSLHPGAVQTELSRNFSMGNCVSSLWTYTQNLFFKNAKQGAQTSIYCAVDEELAKKSGKYYSGCKEKTPSSSARNAEDAERLWNISLDLVGLGDFSV